MPTFFFFQEMIQKWGPIFPLPISRLINENPALSLVSSAFRVVAALF